MAEEILTAEVRMRGHIGVSHCENEFPFFFGFDLDTLNSQIVAEAFYDTIWSGMQVLLHEEFILDQIEAVVFRKAPGVSSPPFILAVNEPGLASGSDCMPAFSTVRFNKVPDNTTKFPTTANNFRLGFFGLSGLPEGDQDKGFLESTILSSWQGIADDLLAFTVNVPGTGPVQLFWGMYRPVPGEDSDTVRLDSAYVVSYVGTRNSRKPY